MDLKQGLVCTLTKEKANFINECRDYILDPEYQERFDDTKPLENHVIKSLVDNNVLDTLRQEQNYPQGLIAGISTGIVGAAIWGAITVATGFQIGFMALAIGAAVGIAIRFSGKGVDSIFGISGAIIAVLSCLLGNFFSIIGFLAHQEDLNYIDTLFLFDYSFLWPIMQETFSIIDLLFYGIAGAEGYKFSFRALTEKDIAQLKEE
ncbi:hypothetical protein [Aquimarina mytili]